MSDTSKPQAGASSPGPAGSALLPCQIPCPKCGSADISRVFRERRETWLTYACEHVRTNRWVDVDRHSGLCLEDIITHHCRVCQWDWETLPLSPNAPASATGREERP